VPLLLAAGLLLVAFGPLPPGAKVQINPGGKSAKVDTTLVSTSTPEPGSGAFANSGHLELTGKVESISPASWTISGLVFAIRPNTGIKGTIVVGDVVKVEAFINADGTITATEIHSYSGDNSSGPVSGTLELTGTVESIAPDQWTVSGVKFAIDPQTQINGMVNIGDQVKVEALLTAEGMFTAHEIHPANDASSSSESDSDDDSGVEMEFTGVVESISADTWVVGGQTFIITAKTKVHGNIVVGDTVKVEAYGDLSGAVTASEIKKIPPLSLIATSGGSMEEDHEGHPAIGTPSPGNDDEHENDH